MPGFLWVDGSLLSAWLWHGHLRVRLWIAWVRLGSLLHSFNASALCAAHDACSICFTAVCTAEAPAESAPRHATTHSANYATATAARDSSRFASAAAA